MSWEEKQVSVVVRQMKVEGRTNCSDGADSPEELAKTFARRRLLWWANAAIDSAIHGIQKREVEGPQRRLKFMV